MINGNTQGIRQALLAQMEAMQEIECDRDVFLPEALMQEMARCLSSASASSPCWRVRSASGLIQWYSICSRVAPALISFFKVRNS